MTPRRGSAAKQQSPIKTVLMFPLALALFIVALPFLVLQFLWGFALTLRFSHIARHEGKPVLLVYSDSPNWKSYLEQGILPRVQEHAIILNWSERAHWNNWSWAVLAFHHWGGTADFNPLAIVFCDNLKVRVFRFYKAFRELKRGNAGPLQEVESQFLQTAMTAVAARQGRFAGN